MVGCYSSKGGPECRQRSGQRSRPHSRGRKQTLPAGNVLTCLINCHPALSCLASTVGIVGIVVVIGAIVIAIVVAIVVAIVIAVVPIIVIVRVPIIAPIVGSVIISPTNIIIHPIVVIGIVGVPPTSTIARPIGHSIRALGGCLMVAGLAGGHPTVIRGTVLEFADVDAQLAVGVGAEGGVGSACCVGGDGD